MLDPRAHANAAGRSDDGFLYGRLGVVACGPDFYESVLADTETMPGEPGFEELRYAASTAYERKTGEELDYQTGCGFGTGSNPDGWPEDPAPGSWRTIRRRSGGVARPARNQRPIDEEAPDAETEQE